jgi:RNAse (barnase) inhibitor barstar
MSRRQPTPAGPGRSSELSALASRLDGPSPSGVYRVGQAVDGAAVRRLAEDHGWRSIVVDGRAARDKASLIEACARAFAFPEWVGRNWDALADALGDLSWLAADGFLVSWQRQRVVTGWETVVEILERATHQLERSGRPMVVLVRGGAGAGLPRP